MSAVDRILIASACKAIGTEVNPKTLLQAVTAINAKSNKVKNFHDLWNQTLLELGIGDLLLLASYQRALSHYYRQRKYNRDNGHRKPIMTEVKWDRARVKINDAVSIEFRVLKSSGTFKDKDVTEDYRVWHTSLRITVSTAEMKSATKTARIAINAFRRKYKIR